MKTGRYEASSMQLAAPVIGVALFSGIINLLGFTGPLFMLEVYDRVIPSGSLPTLVALLILATGLYVFSGFLDVMRGRVLSRVAGIADASLQTGPSGSRRSFPEDKDQQRRA